MDAALRQRIYDFIEQKGLRKTAQRDAIIEQIAFGIRPAVMHAIAHRAQDVFATID